MNAKETKEYLKAQEIINKSIQTKNEEIALMLGWVYVSNVDVLEGKYDKTIKAGWYSRLPKTLHYKFSRDLYRGRSHNHLNFNCDTNWMFEAIDWIENLKLYTFAIDSHPNHGTCVLMHNATKQGITNCIINYVNVNKKEAIFEALYQFSQYLKTKQ